MLIWNQTTSRIRRVLDEESADVRLYCHSEQRREKEGGHDRPVCEAVRDGLKKISDGPTKPRRTKHRDKILQRIGRLKERCLGIGESYLIELAPDAAGEKVVGLSWQKTPAEGSRITHPGVYCLRTNQMDWDEARLWRTYTMLTDLEAVFRSLKSELGLRPVFHQTTILRTPPGVAVTPSTS